MSSVESLSSLYSTATTAAATTTTSTSSSLSSLDFLELFLVQLQNQDPLDPMDTSEMNTQLCNLSQLEQQQLTNEYLLAQIQYQNSGYNAQAVALIGKTVAVEGDAVSKSDGATSDMIIELEKDCSSLTISIHDQDGALVKTIEASDLSSGRHTFEWDGTDNQGQAVEDGNYTYQVSATGSSGNSITVTQYATYDIVAMVTRNDGPCLIAKDGAEIPYSDVVEVRQA
jgi:flagellar basal-body rod modification protein FlgD